MQKNKQIIFFGLNKNIELLESENKLLLIEL